MDRADRVIALFSRAYFEPQRSRPLALTPLPSWTSADPNVSVDVVCVWFLVSPWTDNKEAVVTLGRLDTENAEFGREVVLTEHMLLAGPIFPALSFAWVVTPRLRLVP